MFEKSFRVIDDKGFVGTLRAPARFLDDRTEKVIELENGQKMTVRAEDLKVQQDGSFFLRREGANGVEYNTPEVVVPNTNSVPAPTRDEPASRADVANRPEPVQRADAATRVEPPASSFFSDDYEIERVPIDRIVDVQVESRQEGDTLILPVLEEVIVYQKKMLLKEEVRITRRRRPVEQVRRFDESIKD